MNTRAKARAPAPAKKEGPTTTTAVRKRRPTIRDVSRLAGVSRMTVSRTLAEPDMVQPKTRERVLEAVAHLGYVPNRAAIALSSRRSGFIGLVLPTLTNSNFAMLAHGLTDAVRKQNYHLLIAYNDYSVGEEEEQLRNLLARRPEAIVITGSEHSRTSAKMLLQSDVPVIEVSDLPQRPLQHAIGFSNHEIGRLAARHLISRGLKRIGAVGSQADMDVVDHRGEQRIRGFEEEVRLAGLSLEYVLRQGAPPVSFNHGAAAIATLLDRYPKIEGVFAVSDLSAVGVVMECQRRRIAVPGRLSVIGFGDFEIGREINPPLTTIRVDFRELGRRAGQLLLEILGGNRSAEDWARIDVGLSLIERASVRS